VEKIISFIRLKKKYLKIPIIILLALVVILLVLNEDSAIAPFIYMIF
tara:strand:- start:164 stop:304 length:141 start_codon:yes stop_codon:yes gene_type:complete